MVWLESAGTRLRFPQLLWVVYFQLQLPRPVGGCCGFSGFSPKTTEFDALYSNQFIVLAHYLIIQHL